ncbi:hypothetical protein ATE92_2661 [Ulvibacter sp. MAR_2010_11]|uniref:hypothetical protein n=1 Tax=Ulvibacter sp. MAR_2010_11 TaxID=1250229 RepID=UPI000CB20B0A|nr:hypothetical protein [Ulvibacter sp. MAR_2010_11]PKA84471.1 hypothetical protein ATE92_2661 [Ulvibacter sp. MAR_2010_11]
MNQLLFMKNQFQTILYLLIAVYMFSCNQNSTKSASTAIKQENASNAAIQVTLEDKLYTMQQSNIEPNIKRIFKKDSILLEFWEDGNPLKLNLNLTNTDILENGAATYTIPDINHPRVKVDLNFFNAERDVTSINKRIIFRKGIINITKISESNLEMTFEGEGSGALEYGKNFPISGEVFITY